MDITNEADIFVDSLKEQVVKLALKDAETKHHQYEQENLGGKRDTDWAKWYAYHMKVNEPDLFDGVDGKVIAEALETATKAQVFHPDYTWEQFTASYITDYLLND